MRILKQLSEFLSSLKCQEVQNKIAIGIATTSNEFDQPYFSFPRFIDNWGYYIHVVCADSIQANEIIRHLKSKVDFFFLDMEPKKNKFSAEEIINKNNEQSFHPLYPNFITIKSTLDLLERDVDRIPLIYGHGNIAFQLASNFISLGVIFYWIKSRETKSSKLEKMKRCFGHAEVSTVGELGDKYLKSGILVACYPLNLKIMSELAPERGIKIIDVTGRSVTSNWYSNLPIKLDVSARLVSEISFYLIGNRYKENTGKSVINSELRFVSGGYQADKGDLIVDCFKNPTFLIGVADGLGGLQERINKKLK